MRLNHDDYFIEIAKLVARRSTCIRRSVGCVLVDSQRRILATGYNGVPSGYPHCIDHPCPGASYESGTGLAECESIHAEQNALLQCPDIDRISVCYSTTAPCPICTKLLLNTGCKRIVFIEPYPGWENNKAFFEKKGDRSYVPYSATGRVATSEVVGGYVRPDGTRYSGD